MDWMKLHQEQGTCDDLTSQSFFKQGPVVTSFCFSNKVIHLLRAVMRSLGTCNCQFNAQGDQKKKKKKGLVAGQPPEKETPRTIRKTCFQKATPAQSIMLLAVSTAPLPETSHKLPLRISISMNITHTLHTTLMPPNSHSSNTLKLLSLLTLGHSVKPGTNKWHLAAQKANSTQILHLTSSADLRLRHCSPSADTSDKTTAGWPT